MTDDIYVFVPVEEDWHPSFKIHYQGEIKLVRVTLHLSCLLQKSPFLRVSVWGADDLGMEKDYPPSNSGRFKAKVDFSRILLQNSLTKEWLLKEGFSYC